MGSLRDLFDGEDTILMLTVVNVGLVLIATITLVSWLVMS